MTATIIKMKQNIEHIKGKRNIFTFPIDGCIFAQKRFRHHIIQMDGNRKRATISGRPNRIANGAMFEYLGSRICLDLANMPIGQVIENLKSGITNILRHHVPMLLERDRIYIWNAMHMAETLMDISIKRQRALRRHDIDIDALHQYVDHAIQRLSGILFDIDYVDTYQFIS